MTFEEVYRRHGKALYNFLCYQLGDLDHAEEAFSIVRERIFVHLRRYDPHRAPLVRWLFSIARNAVIDERRNRPKARHLAPDGQNVVVGRSVTKFMSDAPFEQLTVDGTRAAWFAASGRLIWESDGISYQIAGSMLNLDDPLRISKSLR